MFHQNAYVSQKFQNRQSDDTYFKLYYQFIKHAFGLKYIDSSENWTHLRLYFDQFPDTSEKAEKFREYLMNLMKMDDFIKAKIKITTDSIAEIDSHEHILLQCLDIVLGSMAFRLNDKHKHIGETGRRGKRTIAKEKLYQTILHLIYEIYPRFNIGKSTSCKNDRSNRWNFPYMHWCFVPKDYDFDSTQTKCYQRMKNIE